jgi:hypothetical protein
MSTPARTVNLDVKDGGAWRRVTSFDIDQFADGDLEHAAEALLSLSDCEKIKARIITPGETAPLLTWSRAEGWREWRGVGA